MPLYSPARMYILLYEKMSIYLCQKMYKQSYLLHVLLFGGQCQFARTVVPRINVSTALTRWAVPAQAPEAVCHPFASVSSAVPGSPRSPFHGAPEHVAHTPSRPPPGPRSTSFRALGHWETLRRVSAQTTSSREAASPASTSRLRDSQQPRPSF